MHHFLHDLAQSIRGSECQVLGESSVRSTDLSRCRHVSMISLSTIEALQHEAKKVRTIFGWESTSKELDDGGTLEVPKRSTLFQFESLRVLDLRGLRGSDFSSISYKYLKHLRYLDLSSTSIKSLPKWVTRLYHLQTLKLIKCGKLTELPEDLINLKKLRHLFIDNHKKWKTMAQALGKLHQLQTLPLFVACQEDGGCGISVLKNLNDLRGELEIHRLSLVKKANFAKEGILSKKSSLRKLRLHWNRPSSDGGGGGGGDELLVLEVLRPHTNLQCLSIEGFGGVKFPAWVSSGSDLPNLVRLKLSNCNHCEHISSFGGLHRLKELELRSMANLKEWLEGGGVMFPCLEKLLIQDCPSLNKTPKHVFPSLKSLKLENVGGMGVVSITSSSLTSLTSLTITNCEDLEYLQEALVSNNSQLNVVLISNCPILKAFEEEASTADEILPNRFLCELVIDESGVSYAREGILRISKCPELESIGKGFLSSLVFLKRFRVNGCSKLKHIELSQSFKHLRELEIMYCPNFEGFAHHSLRRSEQEEEEVLPCCCHTLKISDCHAISSIDLRRFSSLRELKIVKCKGLKSIIPYVRSFTSLQKLEIWSCPELEEAIPKRFWSSLLSVESLEVFDCAKLKFMIELSQHSFNHLRHLEINECPYFEGFDISTTTEQQRQQLVLPCCHTLKISYCPGISSIDFQSFASLRELQIFNCEGLQALQGLPFLTALQELEIYGCPAISSIDFQSFASLRELQISNCEGLQALQGLPFLTALQKLEIDECPAISSIDFQSFASLRELQIFNCEGLQALQGLPFLTALQELEIYGCPAISSIDFQSFASLRELRISNCEGFQALQGLPFLTALQELEIHGCPAISSIDFQSFASLR
ncbi:hypothetical protein Sjap_008572 [Stephania japonica]|uniref:Uncharacterized protein n=1 Tax=Stephania japonica TaxID=461633 RepID=A0AAP0PB03_9MAGN